MRVMRERGPGIFEPLTMKWSPSCTARVCDPPPSETGVGLGVALAPELLAREHLAQMALLLRRIAPVMVRPSSAGPVKDEPVPARWSFPHNRKSFPEERNVPPRPPYSLRPGDSQPSAFVQLAMGLVEQLPT